MNNHLAPLPPAPSGPLPGTPAVHAVPRWHAAAQYFGTVAFALLGLTACADMSGIASQAKMRDAASLGLAAQAQGVADVARAFADPAVASDWWRGFGDAQLDALIDQALAQSPNLKLAEARIARARAYTEATRAADRPQVNGSLDATRQHYSANSIYPPPLGGATENSATGRLTGSWELDFFGKNRAAIDAAVGSANAAVADAQAARVLLASNVARQYVELARLQAQLGVAQRTLEQRSQTLSLVRDRVSAGLDTRLEERQSEGSLPEARQQIEVLREQAAMARNALDALVGQPGAAQSLVPAPLASLRPIALPAALPADLLGRRADIAAARWRVEAASQEVAVARAQFYPNVNLTAFVGLASLGLDNFVKGGSREWGVGPAIRLPIFEAGRLRANLRGKAADVDAAVESYNATLLDALHETADQIAAARSIDQQMAEQREAQAAAESAYAIAQQRYRAGLGNYLNVLSAETSVLQQRRQAVDLAARRLDTQARLARALGGGYAATDPVLAAAPAAAGAAR